MTATSIHTPRGEMPLYVATPAGPGPWPGVVVIHAALGMSRDVRAHAQWLASEGFLAVAPDLFYWGKRSRCLFALMRGWMPGSELDATRQWLVAHPQCTGRIGVIGFCMGGGFALAVAADHDFDAASVNYGGLTREVERSLPHACPIVGSFGDKDRWPGVRGVPDRIEPILDAAGIDHDIKVYPGAGHGFLNDHHPDELSATDRAIARIVSARFDEPASRDARTRIVAFFRKHLQGGVGPRT